MSNLEPLPVIYHKNLKELRKAKAKVKKSVPADNFSQLCRGFIDLEKEEYHSAPIFDSTEPCKEIEYKTYEEWLEALESARTGEKVVFPYDEPRRLMVGFVVHPDRELHLIGIKNLKDREKFYTPQSRANFISYNTPF